MVFQFSEQFSSLFEFSFFFSILIRYIEKGVSPMLNSYSLLQNRSEILTVYIKN